MKLHAKIIVNPAAGAKSTHRKWLAIRQLLKGSGLSFDYELTQGRGHAVEIARSAAANGYRYLVAVGGDGTVHEVANGIMQTGNAERTTLGVVCTGTGSDLSRSIGTDRDYRRVCSLLACPQAKTIDMGLVRYGNDERADERYFVNSAGIGFDAKVVAATESLPKYFGGTIPYLFGLVRSFITYCNKTVTLKVGERAAERSKVLSVVVANGKYFGGGMCVAPNAELDDGLLDVVVVGDFGKIELLRVFPRVYKGTHLTYPKIRLEKAPTITMESADKFLLHADGEILWEARPLAHADFRLLPHALNLAT